MLRKEKSHFLTETGKAWKMREIRILELIEGAKQARGLTVIIDVLRAFSLECYLYDMGAALIRPVGSVEDAFRLRAAYPGSLMIGERGGRKIDGADFGNTPSGIRSEDVAGKMIFHTTSAGTQGVDVCNGFMRSSFYNGGNGVGRCRAGPMPTVCRRGGREVCRGAARGPGAGRPLPVAERIFPAAVRRCLPAGLREAAPCRCRAR